MNEVKKFVEALQNDPRAKELVAGMEVPVDEEKGIDAYLDLAKKLGFSISREDLLSWKQEKEKEYKARAEKAQASMTEELDPQKMSMVAGGKGDEGCDSTVNPGEWCWFNDWCDHLINVYTCVGKSEY